VSGSGEEESEVVAIFVEPVKSVDELAEKVVGECKSEGFL